VKTWACSDIADGTSFIALPLPFGPKYDIQCPVYAFNWPEETGRILLNNLHLMNKICTAWISCTERAQQNVCGKKLGSRRSTGN
jgi:hypothetical protein